MLHICVWGVEVLVVDLRGRTDIAEQPVDVDVQLEDIVHHTRDFFGQL